MYRSALEDKVEAHGYDLRRRLADSQTEDMGLNVLTTQIHDMEDMEWMLDEESQLLLRKHIICNTYMHAYIISSFHNNLTACHDLIIIIYCRLEICSVHATS